MSDRAVSFGLDSVAGVNEAPQQLLEERPDAQSDDPNNQDDEADAQGAGQFALFDLQEPWRAEWVGMPEFVQQDLTPWKSLVVHFATPGDMHAFSQLIEQKLTPNTRSVWFPEAEIGRYANKRYTDEP